jgi:hypothetical protein
MNNEILFSERQRFNIIGSWLFLLIAFGILHFVEKMPLKDLVSNTSILLILVLVLLSICRLDTEIREDGIYYQFFPFQLKMKKIAFDDIEKNYVRKYKPIMEYGGWGYKFGVFGKGWAINIAGNKGIQIEFKDSKKRKFLIGTQKSEEVEAVLGKLKN